MKAGLNLKFFGSFQLFVEGAEVEIVSRPVQELLAMLALGGPSGCDRETLAKNVWPESDLERGRFYLRRSLSQLRTFLGAERDRLVNIGDHRVELNLRRSEADVLQFDHLISGSELAQLPEAIRVYQGPFLLGSKNVWARAQRAHYRQEFANSLLKLATDAEASGDLDHANEWLRKGLEEDPTREDLLRRKMQLSARQGRFAEIVRSVKEVRQRLQKQFNLPLQPETQQMYRELMEDAQLMESTSPRQVPEPVTNPIPIPLTPFIGREAELQTLLDANRQHRVVTITGIGGVGKSRLAIEAIQAVRDKYDQIIFADLSVCDEASDVRGLLGRSAGIAALPKSIVEALTQLIGTKEVLLVLDGAERFVSECNSVLGVLIANCPNLRVITTSRLSLGAGEEYVQTLTPLSTKSAKGLDSEALSYLMVRASTLAPNFKISSSSRIELEKICDQLDGLPLALELAAVRLRTMPPDEMLIRLNDSFKFLERAPGSNQRHRSLQAVLDWSYRLLSPEEATLFGRLSVFPSLFSAQAAQVICGNPPLKKGLIPVILADLANHSLVEYDADAVDGRYRLLRTVRSYAADRGLEGESSSQAFQESHANYYLQVAASFEDDPTCTERFRLNEPNFTSAINWFLGQPDRASKLKAVRLVNGLFVFWATTGKLSYGIDLAQRVIEGCGSEPDDAIAECLLRAGGNAHILGNLELSDRLYERAYGCSRKLGLESWTLEAMRGRGDVAANAGRLSEAEKLLNEALLMATKMGDEFSQAQCMASLGYVARLQLQTAKARELTSQAMAIYTALGNHSGRLWCAGSLACVFVADDQPGLAIPLIEETLEHQRRLENRLAEAWNLTMLGQCRRMVGEFEEARLLLEEAIAIRRALDKDLPVTWQNLELALLDQVTGRIAEAQERLLVVVAESKKSAMPSFEAQALLALAQNAFAEEDWSMSAAYLKMCEPPLEAHHSPSIRRGLDDLRRQLEADGHV